MAALLTVLAATLPVTRERLDRFAALTGLTVTTEEAQQVVGHFRALRRWRLGTLAIAAPLAGFTHDPFYLVLGWCAVSVVLSRRSANPHDEERVYRGAWLLGLTGAVLAGAYLLLDQGFTSTWLAHTGIAVAVTAAVTFSTREKPVTGRIEPAIGHWSMRNGYLAATAIVLSGALLTPGRSALPEPPAHTPPLTFPRNSAGFQKVDEYRVPMCSWSSQLDADCRSWLVNGEPFPQAAPYLLTPGKAPRQAPFTRSPDKKALVYLDRYDRRMTYQNSEGVHHLGGALADADVPRVAFAGQNRYVALIKHDARITDTKTWTTLIVPDARHVHDLGESGIVVATADRALVLDHGGKTRMSLPLRELPEDARPDGYHLHPDGHRLVVILGGEGRVETYDTKTGRRLGAVTPVFRGDDFLGVGLGWSEKGAFQVRSAIGERVHNLDLSNGKLWR